MGGRLPIILLAAVLAVSGCRDEQAALMAPLDPEPAGAVVADVAGVAVADSTTETETCETIEVEVDDDGKTKTVYLCRRDSEDAGESVGADVVAGDGGDGTICWYWVVEYRIAGILVGRTVTFLFCEDDSGGCGGGGPGGGGPQADCVAASLTLKCPTAERGSTATCTATVAEDDEVDASELVFDRFENHEVVRGARLTVTGGGISEMSESVTIAVTARPWALYETISWDSPNYFHDLDPDIWGAHDVTPDEEPAELSGNGPWDGTVIIASRPNIYSNLWLHTDFLSDGASYGKVDSIPTHAHPCVRGLGSSATVYELNGGSRQGRRRGGYRPRRAIWHRGNRTPCACCAKTWGCGGHRGLPRRSCGRCMNRAPPGGVGRAGRRAGRNPGGTCAPLPPPRSRGPLFQHVRPGPGCAFCRGHARS